MQGLDLFNECENATSEFFYVQPKLINLHMSSTHPPTVSFWEWFVLCVWIGVENCFCTPENAVYV